MRSLESVVIELDLRNPENRRIINAYRRASTERTNEIVYAPLVAEHPELRRTCEMLVDESDKDYVASRDKGMMQVFAMVSVMAPGLAEPPEMPGAEEGEKVVERVYEILSLTARCFQLYDEFWWNVVNNAKNIAGNGSAQDVVKTVEGRDRICRLMFPTRAEAEYFTSVSMRLTRKMSSSGSKFASIMDEAAAKDNPISPRRYAILDEALVRFSASEYDRVYGKA